MNVRISVLAALLLAATPAFALTSSAPVPPQAPGAFGDACAPDSFDAPDARAAMEAARAALAEAIEALATANAALDSAGAAAGEWAGDPALAMEAAYAALDEAQPALAVAYEAVDAAVEAVAATAADPAGATAPALAQARSAIAVALAAVASAERLAGEAAVGAVQLAGARASEAQRALDAVLNDPAPPHAIVTEAGTAASDAESAAAEGLASAEAGARSEAAAADATARALARRALLGGPVVVWTSLNMGAGSCLDADRVDGFEARDFLALIDAEVSARERADAALAGATDALAERAARLEGRAGVIENRTGSLEARTAELERSVGVVGEDGGIRIPDGGRVAILRSEAARITSARVGSTLWGAFVFGEFWFRVTAVLADGNETHAGEEVRLVGRLTCWDCSPYYTLDWTPVEGATKYRVYRATAPRLEGVPLPYAETAAPSFADAGFAFSSSRVAVPPRLHSGAELGTEISYVGTLGVGTSAPTRALDVVGSGRLTNDLSAATLNASDELVVKSASTVGSAVTVPVRGTGLLGGRLVELNETDPTQYQATVRHTQTALSRSVLGVLVTDPGVRLGGASSSAQVAVSGVASVNVVGAVRAGDLLVSSARPGSAMACPAGTDCTGAIVGKALEDSWNASTWDTIRMLVAPG